MNSKADIIARLKREILPLQGFKDPLQPAAADCGLGIINAAFPNRVFPTGAVHEFITGSLNDLSATCGFIAGIAAALLQQRGALLWISANRDIFPPALRPFGIRPEQIIFIHLKKEKELLWVMEEALKCEGLSAVIGEINELGFTASRRLQLAVEASRVTGFLLRRSPKSMNITASLTRWQITTASSEPEHGLPGVGLPRWNVELLKVRNGRPGKWVVEFSAGRFRHISRLAVIAEQKRKTG